MIVSSTSVFVGPSSVHLMYSPPRVTENLCRGNCLRSAVLIRFVISAAVISHLRLFESVGRARPPRAGNRHAFALEGRPHVLDVDGDDIFEFRSAVGIVSPDAVENLLSRHAFGVGGEVFVDSFLDRLIAEQALWRN